jgi:hypothetical protein
MRTERACYRHARSPCIRPPQAFSAGVGSCDAWSTTIEISPSASFDSLVSRVSTVSTVPYALACACSMSARNSFDGLHRLGAVEDLLHLHEPLRQDGACEGVRLRHLGAARFGWRCAGGPFTRMFSRAARMIARCSSVTSLFSCSAAQMRLPDRPVISESAFQERLSDSRSWRSAAGSCRWPVDSVVWPAHRPRWSR